MSDIDPAAASHEVGSAIRPHQQRSSEEEAGATTAHLADEHEERVRGTNRADRTESGDADRAREGDAPRSVSATPPGERVDLESDFPPQNDRVPRSTEEARELARETRMRMEDRPDRAMDTVRNLEQDAGSTRISRAIDALN